MDHPLLPNEELVMTSDDGKTIHDQYAADTEPGTPGQFFLFGGDQLC